MNTILAYARDHGIPVTYVVPATVEPTDLLMVAAPSIVAEQGEQGEREHGFGGWPNTVICPMAQPRPAVASTHPFTG